MAKKQVRFNKSAIQSLEIPPSGRSYYYDSRTPGLAVCVTSSGTKTFYLIKKIQGRPVRYRIGRCDEISVEQARNLTTEKLAEIVRGENPQRKRQYARKGLLLETVFEHWMDHAKAHKKSWKHDESIINGHLKRLAKRRLEDLTRGDVAYLHNAIRKKSGLYMANRTLAVLRSAINKAKTELGFKGENPCIGIKLFREESRDRFLQPDELPRFFQALDEEPSLLRDFFLMCLLTGARRGNVLSMRWTDIQQTIWRIPETKKGSPVLIPLVPAAIAVLEERRKEVPDESPWVFYSVRSKSGRLTDPKTAWHRICDRAEIDDLRIHDLRRTLGSWLAMGGASLPIIGKALGHESGSSATAVYARLMLDPVREQLEQATSAILANMSDNKETAEKEVSEDNRSHEAKG
jgi:integrase